MPELRTDEVTAQSVSELRLLQWAGSPHGDRDLEGELSRVQNSY